MSRSKKYRERQWEEWFKTPEGKVWIEYMKARWEQAQSMTEIHDGPEYKDAPRTTMADWIRKPKASSKTSEDVKAQT